MDAGFFIVPFLKQTKGLIVLLGAKFYSGMSFGFMGEGGHFSVQ
jgi:hypothetical protein